MKDTIMLILAILFSPLIIVFFILIFSFKAALNISNKLLQMSVNEMFENIGE